MADWPVDAVSADTDEVYDQFHERRRLLKAMVAAGAFAAVPGCSRGPESTGPTGKLPFHKDPAAFIRHGTNLEARIENLGGFITPNEHFFVRNHSFTPRVSLEDYRLVVEGDAVRRPVELTYDDLLEMPSRTVYNFIECGGNQRSFFARLMGRTARGTQWGRGGIGMAIWTGVPMKSVLERAEITESAVDVQQIGLDVESAENGFRRPIPIDRAMHEDTLLAYRMNGAVLPPDHGYPIRTIVPGWVGSTNIKWLGKLEVSSQKIWSKNNTRSYVLIGDAYEPEGEARGKVATLQSVKSELLLPWPAQLEAGPRLLRGYAHSGQAPIERVEWSTDGEHWREARLIEPILDHAWARFEFRFRATPGQHVIVTRATDQAGNVQPDSLPFNEKGYLFNLPLQHPITVA